MKLRVGSKQLIKDLNISVVVDTIRKHEPISRVDIAELTRLGRSTVTGIVNLLLKEELIVEVGSAESRGGRKPVLLKLNPQARYAIGIKLGPSLITVALTDLHAGVLSKVTRPISSRQGPKAIFRALLGAIEDVTRDNPRSQGRIIGIGVVLPGIVDPSTGTSVSSHLLNWANIPVKALLEAELNIPVFVDNDANAFALAEKWYGAGRGKDNLLCVTVGVGVGGGIIANGQLYRGSIAGAGEIGHITIDEHGPLCACGNSGCLEALASDGAVVRSAREAMDKGQKTSILEVAGGDPSAVTREIVVSAAREGDRVARRILRETGQHLGTGIANAINLLNPERIVVGGEAVQQAGDLLLEPLRESMKKRSFSILADRVDVVPAALGENAWLMGAATLVLEEVFKPPIYGMEGNKPTLAIPSLVDPAAEGR
ncbi:MAG: ROK family transcriptional regulator [Firmicutes bacterium]|nr:ROK family transcriptional regulator [Bacillota bacterium]